MRHLIMFSGGIKSTTLLKYVIREGEAIALYFEHGFVHEQVAAHQLADHLGVEFIVETLTGSPSKVQGWPLFKTTWMLFHALTLASQFGCQQVCYGICSRPWCRENTRPYLDTLRLLVQKAQGELPTIEIEAPLILLHTTDVVQLGNRLEVPWIETRSCEHNEILHCGRCIHCRRRAVAFSLTETFDPTVYVQSPWKEDTSDDDEFSED